MKRCPKCGLNYTDETLNFCLDDGEWLNEVSSSEEPATAILKSEARTQTHNAETSPSDPTPTSRTSLISNQKSVVTGIVGVLLVAAVGVGTYWLYGNKSTKQIDSIAVMPFVNESGNPEFEYVSDGVTEELITSLIRLPGLTVKPRSTIIRYKGQNTDAKMLGKELEVAAILNGSVAQRGDEVALHVELVDATTDTVLWSDDYRKPLSALATLHNEIARDISEKLRARLSSTDQRQLARKYTDKPEAYQLYLKGRFHWNKRTKNDMYKAIEYFQQATNLDPNYALAYAGLADSYLLLPGYDRAVSPRENSIKAREYASRAWSLDESLAEAHVAVARVLEYYDFDFSGAERELKRAIELDPNYAFAFQSYGYLLTSLGRLDEAEANYKKALALEPASPEVYRSYAQRLMMARRYDECEEQLKKAIELEPNYVLAYYSLANLNMLRDRYFEVMDAYARGREAVGDQETAAGIRESFAKGGYVGFIRDYTSDRWELNTPRYIHATNLLSIGEKEKAMALLEKAYEDREGFITLINVDPRLDALRDEPRFQELIRKVGFR